MGWQKQLSYRFRVIVGGALLASVMTGQISVTAALADPNPTCSPTITQVVLQGANFDTYDFRDIGTCDFVAPRASSLVQFLLVAGGSSGTDLSPGLGGQVVSQLPDSSLTINVQSDEVFTVTVGDGGMVTDGSVTQQGQPSMLTSSAGVNLTALPQTSFSSTGSDLLGTMTFFGGSGPYSNETTSGAPNIGQGGSGGVNSVAPGNGGTGRVILMFPAVDNGGGGGGPVDPPSGVTPPSEPRFMQVEAGVKNAFIFWNDPVDYGGDFDPVSNQYRINYVVRYRVAESTDGWTEVSPTSDLTKYEVFLHNLTVGVTYEVQVAAVNSAGRGNFCPLQQFHVISGNVEGTNAKLHVGMMHIESADGALRTDSTKAEKLITEYIDQGPNLIEMHIFDGLSLDAWANEMETDDVILLPKIRNSYGGSHLIPDLIPGLRAWISCGGRLVVTAAAHYQNDLDSLFDLPINTFQFDDPDIDFNQLEDPGLGTLANQINSHEQPSILMTPQLIDANFRAAYGDRYPTRDETNLAHAGVVEGYVGRGAVEILSFRFDSSDSDWGDVLRQAIYGTVFDNLLIHPDSHMSYFANEGGIDTGYGYSGQDQMVGIGTYNSRTTLSCVNTVHNPAIITHSAKGITLDCGTQRVFDRRSKGQLPLEVSLQRFFSSTSGWIVTRSIVTNPADNGSTLHSQIAFSGRSPWEDFPIFDNSDDSPNLPSDIEALDDFVDLARDFEPRVSAAANNDNFMRLVLSSTPVDFRNGGGSDDWAYRVDLQELVNNYNISLTAGNSMEFDWAVNYPNYSAGCFKHLRRQLWQNSYSFLPSIIRPDSGTFLDNDQINFEPLLTDTSDCETFNHWVDRIDLSSSNGELNVSWPRLADTSEYRLEYAEIINGRWYNGLPQLIPQSAGAIVSSSISQLKVGSHYVVWVTPIQHHRTLEDDSAEGYLAYSSPITIVGSSDSRLQQFGPAVAATVKKGKSIKIALVGNPDTIPLNVATTANCKIGKALKTTITRKKVGKKVKIIKKSVQVGWLLTGVTKGKCVVSLFNEGNEDFKPLSEVQVVTVN